MTLPPNDSPLWYLARLAVIGALAALLLTVNYQNGFVPEVDLDTILWLIVGTAGYDGITKFAQRSNRP